MEILVYYRNWILLILESLREAGDSSVRLIAIHLAKHGLGDQLLNILVKAIEPTCKEERNIACSTSFNG